MLLVVISRLSEIVHESKYKVVVLQGCLTVSVKQFHATREIRHFLIIVIMVIYYSAFLNEKRFCTTSTKNHKSNQYCMLLPPT